MGKLINFRGGKVMSPSAIPREPEACARDVLNQYNLNTVPIDPMVITEALGINVMEVNFKSSEVSGLIEKEDQNTTIYINAEDPPSRKRFTIAHELGHLFIHLQDKNEGNFLDSNEIFFRSNLFSQYSNPKKEKEANQFAAALLMPSEHVKSEWLKSYSVEYIAARFQVSYLAMENRLKNLRIF